MSTKGLDKLTDKYIETSLSPKTVKLVD